MDKNIFVMSHFKTNKTTQPPPPKKNRNKNQEAYGPRRQPEQIDKIKSTWQNHMQNIFFSLDIFMFIIEPLL